MEIEGVVNSHGRFVWYELVTTDVKAATAFYSKVMGWGAWDASVPGKACILFGDGKGSISALTELQDDARQMGARHVTASGAKPASARSQPPAWWTQHCLLRPFLPQPATASTVR